MPDGDILIHAGDITNHGSIRALANFNAWLGELPHKHKLVIAGNHDFCFKNNRTAAEKTLSNAIYLQDAGFNLNNVQFWGSPWTPEFSNWAFMANEDQLQHTWQKIPDDTNVLITHGPPSKMMSFVERDGGVDAGSWSLHQRILELKLLRVHVFGHIHEGYGSKGVGDLTFINASSCDEHYRLVNPPIVMDL